MREKKSHKACVFCFQLADEVMARLSEFGDKTGRKDPDYDTVLNLYSTYRHVRNILATYATRVDPA